MVVLCFYGELGLRATVFKDPLKKVAADIVSTPLVNSVVNDLPHFLYNTTPLCYFVFLASFESFLRPTKLKFPPKTGINAEIRRIWQIWRI